MEPLENRFIERRFIHSAWLVLVLLLICRMGANYFIPLNDTTEARYGEIARKMVETGNWVTPQHDYGVPFWAKPPLSTWLSASSMSFWGVNEFAARLPSLLLSLATVYLIWGMAKSRGGRDVGLVAALVLSGTFFFFLDAGVVMTEPALIFCISLSFVAFWHALVKSKRLWSYLFFVGLGLGLLAKGPIAVILVGLPLFFWVLIRREWLRLWQRLPWITGSILMLAISLPWYLLAERRTPGFLNYFIMGEHIHRFLTPGWTGDKYGFAHYAPKGMIWLYAFVGLLPWTFIALTWLVRNAKKVPALCSDPDGWVSYLLLCTLLPLGFFTFASNIIYPYVFPSLPTFALLFAELWQRSGGSLAKKAWIPVCALIPGVLALVATAFFILEPTWVAKTQKPVISAWLSHVSQPNSDLIYWGKAVDFSAQFYSAGKAKSAATREDLERLISSNSEHYLVVNSKELDKLPKEIMVHCSLVETVPMRKEQLLLFFLI